MERLHITIACAASPEPLGGIPMFTIQKNPPQANVPRNIRFTEELFEKLNRVSTENDVSFNSLVLQCCRYALDELAKNGVENDVSIRQ